MCASPKAREQKNPSANHIEWTHLRYSNQAWGTWQPNKLSKNPKTFDCDVTLRSACQVSEDFRKQWDCRTNDNTWIELKFHFLILSFNKTQSAFCYLIAWAHNFPSPPPHRTTTRNCAHPESAHPKRTLTAHVWNRALTSETARPHSKM